MAPPIQVTPDDLDQPSRRFAILGNDIGQLDNEIGAQSGAAKGAAGHKEVSDGLDTCSQGISGALQALDSDACLLGGNIGKAKIMYQVNDKHAYHVTSLDSVPNPPAHTSAPAPKSHPSPHPTPSPSPGPSPTPPS